ncbi:MAG: hypothetical protein NXI13_04990 [Proteobacteria bacterium]|nr:hypothetical protein [Pseudomonadota bacterium]
MSPQTALRLSPIEDDLSSMVHVAQFVIRADIEPSVLPRILENFALRNLTPLHLSAKQDNGELTIELTVEGLSNTEEAHLQLRLQNILPVNSVNLDRCI